MTVWKWAEFDPDRDRVQLLPHAAMSSRLRPGPHLIRIREYTATD